MIKLLLLLLWTFIKIGAFTFGGGYAIVAVIQDELVRLGLITAEEIMDFIVISEATPGTFAINVAIFSGFKTAGIWGAIISMIGLIIPSIIIITLIAKFYDKFKQSKVIENILKGIRAVIVGVIFGVGLKMAIQTLSPAKLTPLNDLGIALDMDDMINLLIVMALTKCKFKKISPILMIIIGVVLSLIVYYTL